MIQKKGNARPKALKPSVRNLIAQKAIDNPNIPRDYLAYELIKEIKDVGDIPPTFDTCVKYISEYRSNRLTDKPWSTAALNAEPLLPMPIKWLIALQAHRKSCYSKLMTVREAKWFNRLSGLRETMVIPPSHIEIHKDLQDIFLSLVVATLAQEYAYRERMDIITGNNEADFTDLDNNVATGNLLALYQYAEKWWMDAANTIANKENITSKDVTRFADRYLMPSLISLIRFAEVNLLAHSIGDPEMSDTAALCSYVTCLTVFLFSTNIKERFRHLPHHLKIRSLVDSRKWAIENPGANKETVSLMLGKILGITKKDGA